MNYSGLLVVFPPERTEAGIAALNALDGVEVHHSDPATGRIVAVQECERIQDEVDGLKRIKKLPGIILAELVYHHFEEDPMHVTEIPADLEDPPGGVPGYLKERAS
ncbi:MAG: chaperone NapD [Pseudomonadota bacterium]|nr:chaperone NapD [Pseudomonadota bacterium]